MTPKKLGAVKSAAIARTIDSALRTAFGDGWTTDADVVGWPPHLFAAAAIILKASGAYTRVLRNWPPADDWPKLMRQIGRSWRERLREGSPSSAIPSEISERWGRLVANADTSMEGVMGNSQLASDLIEIMAIADECCVGLGLPVQPFSTGRDKTFERAASLLALSSTLTPALPPSFATVLPKQHVPQSGMTLRSMSHHLGIHFGGDVSPKWRTVPHDHGARLNLVLAPWPLDLVPTQFSEAASDNVRMADDVHGCFSYTPRNDLIELEAWLRRLMAGAARLCGRVDGVVFPEGALSQSDFDVVEEIVLGLGSFIVAGVIGKTDSGVSRNQVLLKTDPKLAPIVQSKHHRWVLDKKQIEMYGLGCSLEPSKRWWENIEIDSRAVNFAVLHSDLTLCCLICEDLARQDPVADLVRTVGPNLVIALLADGPQLGQRWPGRYATVLAEDPGSSVLTLTSLGMCALTKPPRGKQPSRSIALWKDAFGDVQEIELKPNALGVVLSLRTQIETEWTADGRSDEKVASYPILVGAHQVMST